MGCVCNECIEKLENQARKQLKNQWEVDEEKNKLTNESGSMAHNLPILEIPFLTEDNKRYYEAFCFEVNYCCVCGEGSE